MLRACVFTWCRTKQVKIIVFVIMRLPAGSKNESHHVVYAVIQTNMLRARGDARGTTSRNTHITWRAARALKFIPRRTPFVHDDHVISFHTVLLRSCGYFPSRGAQQKYKLCVSVNQQIWVISFITHFYDQKALVFSHWGAGRLGEISSLLRALSHKVFQRANTVCIFIEYTPVVEDV